MILFAGLLVTYPLRVLMQQTSTNWELTGLSCVQCVFQKLGDAHVGSKLLHRDVFPCTFWMCILVQAEYDGFYLGKWRCSRSAATTWRATITADDQVSGPPYCNQVSIFFTFRVFFLYNCPVVNGLRLNLNCLADLCIGDWSLSFWDWSWETRLWCTKHL